MKWGPPFTSEKADQLLSNDIARARKRHANRLKQVERVTELAAHSQVASERSAARKQRALELRKTGATYRAIGKELNVSPHRARDLVREAEWLIARKNHWTLEMTWGDMPQMLEEYFGKPWYQISPETIRSSDMTGFVKKWPHCSVQTLQKIQTWALTVDQTNIT